MYDLKSYGIYDEVRLKRGITCEVWMNVRLQNILDLVVSNPKKGCVFYLEHVSVALYVAFDV